MSEIVDIICEFVEVVIHNVLHVRKLYPETVFTKKCIYGLITHKSINPAINAYIENIIKAVQFHLKGNSLKKIFISLNAKGKIVEKYVIDILSFCNTITSDVLHIALEQYLRSFLLKLQNTGAYFNPLPDDCEFTIQIQLQEESHINFNDNPQHDDFPWMNFNDTSLSNSNILPFDQIKTNNLNIQVYVEKY